MGKPPAPDLVILHIHRLEDDSLGAASLRILELETTVATLKADLEKALKSVRKLKARRLKDAEAERLEDEAHAAQVAALQERIDEGTATDEERALLTELVAELDEEDGPDDEGPPTDDGTTPPTP